MDEYQLANKLITLRKANNYSQEALAEQLAVSRQAISKWERAESIPDTDNLIKLAKLYKISLDELVQTNTGATSSQQQPENPTKHTRYFILQIVLLVACITLAIWQPIWISFLWIPFCYSLYSLFSKK